MGLFMCRSEQQRNISSWNFDVFVFHHQVEWRGSGQAKPLKEQLYSSQCSATHVLLLHDAVYIEHVPHHDAGQGRHVTDQDKHDPDTSLCVPKLVTWSEMYSRTVLQHHLFSCYPPVQTSFALTNQKLIFGKNKFGLGLGSEKCMLLLGMVTMLFINFMFWSFFSVFHFCFNWHSFVTFGKKIYQSFLRKVISSTYDDMAMLWIKEIAIPPSTLGLRLSFC